VLDLRAIFLRACAAARIRHVGHYYLVHERLVEFAAKKLFRYREGTGCLTITIE
jgi:hypothetical protein